jgi:hypothetical protein
MSEPTETEIDWPLIRVRAHVLLDEGRTWDGDAAEVVDAIKAALDAAHVVDYRFHPREIWMRRTTRAVLAVDIPAPTKDEAKRVRTTLNQALADADGVTKSAVSITVWTRPLANIYAWWRSVGDLLAQWSPIGALRRLPRNWRGRMTPTTKLLYVVLTCGIALVVSWYLLWWPVWPYALPWILVVTGPIGAHNWVHGAVYWVLLLSVLISLTRVLEAVYGKQLLSPRQPITHTRLRLWRRLISEGGSAVGIGIAQLVGAFSAAYLQASHDHPTGIHACFDGGTIRQLDALYVTIGTLTTAGTGQLQPHSHLCRGIVSVQMGTGLVVIGLGVAGLVAHLVEREEAT